MESRNAIMKPIPSKGMIRTQIQLTKEQVRALKHLAARESRSLADLVRQSVELYLSHEKETGRALKVELGLEAIGKFSSGSSTGSSEHDKHLADAYRR